MPKRPLSVTLVAILLLVQAGLNLMTLAAARQDPSILAKVLPPGATEEVAKGIPIAMFACVIIALIGIGLLRGLNWARIAVVALAIFAVLVALLQSAAFLFPAALQALMAFLLYRPAANLFFAHKRRGQTPLDRPDDGTPPSSGGNSGTFVA